MLLILIRHAKSSWEYDVKDHERPLSNRGISDAQLVFKEVGIFLPKKYSIWSSSSNRTTQTLNIFKSINNIFDNQISFKSELYTFDSKDLENVIKKNKTENLIIFGHNNAITDFVNKFGNYYIENVPTCGVVILKFEEYNIYTPNKGVITKKIFPRDIK